ncbi:MAG: hypothetical protein K9M45_06205 [Kiritimatiellales bacterium]|nr:hypothetical protein [Kiritimatiellales bacterium]
MNVENQDAHVEAESRVNEPVTIVIFGASGDLTHRKLIPALYIAYVNKLLPENFSIVGFARRDYDDEIFRGMMDEAIRDHARIPAQEEPLKEFISRITYHKGDLTTIEAYQTMAEKLSDTARIPSTGCTTYRSNRTCSILQFSI